MRLSCPVTNSGLRPGRSTSNSGSKTSTKGRCRFCSAKDCLLQSRSRSRLPQVVVLSRLLPPGLPSLAYPLDPSPSGRAPLPTSQGLGPHHISHLAKYAPRVSRCLHLSPTMRDRVRASGWPQVTIIQKGLTLRSLGLLGTARPLRVRGLYFIVPVPLGSPSPLRLTTTQSA